MITVCEKNQCTGCMACTNVCFKNAIEIRDDISSYNAVIDESKCIKCGACYKVCQINTDLNLEKPIFWKQGWANDERIRKTSSSGGLASAIELAFIKSGGVVCSCKFDNGEFIFSIAESEEEVKKFSGSKYVKSNLKDIYIKIKEKLNEGIKVLFVGLPCQVSAVKKFITNQENLFTIDLICHGTPSPKTFKYFVANKCELKAAKEVTFRDGMIYRVKVDEALFAPNNTNDCYSYAFLNSTIFTENCYHCKYAGFSRVSDLTLGDSWGTNLEIQEQKKGISLALAQNRKGIFLLENSPLVLFDVDVKQAKKHNRQLNAPSKMPEQRKQFFYLLKNSKNFKYAFRKCFPQKYIKVKIKQLIKIA